MVQRGAASAVGLVDVGLHGSSIWGRLGEILRHDIPHNIEEAKSGGEH